MNKEIKKVEELIMEDQAPKIGREVFWKVVVVALIVLVGAQTAVMYYFYSRKDKSPVVQKPEGDAVLRPRLASGSVAIPNHIQAPANTSQNQILRPAPLPKVNLNLNNMPGVRPKVQQQTTQTQAPVNSPHLSPMGMRQRMQSMSGNSGMNIQAEFERMQKMMDQMFSNQGMSAAMNRHNMARGGGGGGLNMNVASPKLTEEGNNYVVKLTIPGLDETQVNARVRNNILTLSGIQTEEVENKSQYGTSYSRSTSSFQNSFSLPGPIKDQGLSLNYKNDTLTVVIPKA